MSRSSASTIVLVTPYLADANNGNWRTAARWARLLSPSYKVIVQAAAESAFAENHEDASVLLALHARRSRSAIARWKAARPERPLVVALTGTDLYEDLPRGDADTRLSLDDADRLIVLQEDAPRHLPPPLRVKADVVFQSARSLRPWSGKPGDRFHCVLVAHLRAVKDPETVFAAWRLVPRALPITLDIIGDALDPKLGRAASEIVAADPRVRWLGPCNHSDARHAIRHAHLLLCPSLAEGGANVVVEAITSGTPVLGSRISGNVGMLGEDYVGYFPVQDHAKLAAMLLRCLEEPEYYRSLVEQCAARAPRFTPEAERTALLAALDRAFMAANLRIDRGSDVLPQ